ncbi:MAG: hypothetical protein AAF726_11090 [Planctomycetota bacterium]
MVRPGSDSSLTGEFEDLNTPTLIDVALAGGALTMSCEFLGRVVCLDLPPDLLYHETELVNGSGPFFGSGPEVELFSSFEARRGEVSQSEIDAGDGSARAQVGPAMGVAPTSGPNMTGRQSGAPGLDPSTADPLVVPDLTLLGLLQV